jgi:predicted DNA-binding WGR domain protein
VTTRRFECREDGASKFWEVWVEGERLFTRHGRIGSDGRVTDKVFASGAEAERARDKLIKEKTGKGYVEAGAVTPTPAPAPTPAPSRSKTKAKTVKGAPADVRSVLAPFGFPHAAGAGLCFDPEGDALYARGYPHLRLLTDEVTPTNKIESIIENALEAIDPFFRIAMPRDVARSFLLGYRVGCLLFVDEYTPQRVQNAKLRVERLELMRSDRAIDVALLADTLDAHAWGMGTDTYARWRWPKVLYLYECFLGTEPVARAVVDHLVRSANDFPRWGFAGTDPNRANSVHHYIAAALAWLFVRLSPDVVVSLRERLARECPPPSNAGPTEPRNFLALIEWLARDDGAPPPGLGLEAIDGRGLDAALANPYVAMWEIGRVAWLRGTSSLGGPLGVSGYDLPRMIDAIAPLRDPAIVRVVARIATQRAGRKAAGDWLRAHADYARPIVTALAAVDDPKEQKAASEALALLGAKTIAEPKPLTDDEVEAEIARVFGALAEKLHATTDEAAHIAAIKDAHEAYTEIRAAAGDPIPEAYFTHRFVDFGLADWGMLAADHI